MRWSWVLLAVSASSIMYVSEAETEKMPDFICDTNKDCANYPGTICVTVESNDLPIKMCTPNTKNRPACLNGQYGMCPSYVELPDDTVVNAQCIFIADDSVAPDARSRQLQSAIEEDDDEVAASGSGAVDASNDDDEDEDESDDTPVDSDGEGTPAKRSFAKYKIDKKTVYGIFQCVDIAACKDYAADPSTCEPTACGGKGTTRFCNNQGTCTHRSFQSIKQRSCVCDKGHTGSRCEKTESSFCDVTCGYGGDCVDGECECREGFNGKKRDGRCSKCTSDEACENGATCDTDTGKCTCEVGYEGPTCKIPQDECVTTDCGKGFCQLSNGKAECLCEVCEPECKKCTTDDCSECPDAGAANVFNHGILLVGAAALFVNMM